MWGSKICGQDPIFVAVGASVIAIHLVVLGVAIKDRWDQHNPDCRTKKGQANSRRVENRQMLAFQYLSNSALFNTAQTGGYPYISTADEGSNTSRSATLPVRYGKDGRRRLAGGAASVSTDKSHSLEYTELRGASDPTGRAMSSPDVILAVFGFLDRQGILACGNVSVAFNQAATDDTIWINFVKSDIASFLWEHHYHGSDAARSSFSAQEAALSRCDTDMIQAGIYRAIEYVYAYLPRAYFEIYPRLPPTRELVPSPKAHKSWHRLYITMLHWMPYMVLKNSRSKGVRCEMARNPWVQAAAQMAGSEKEKRESTGSVRLAVWSGPQGKMALSLTRKSRATIEKYSATAFFPEQILSFVSRLYFSCCGDYFEELISLSTGGQQRGGQPADLPEKQKHVTPVVPGWGDMMSVVRGYVDLYKMRVFFVLKENRGFLLQDPAPPAAVSRTNDSSEDNADVADPEAQGVPKRQLRIACSHKIFMETVENPVKSLTEWPYAQRMSVEAFVAEFRGIKSP